MENDGGIQPEEEEDGMNATMVEEVSAQMNNSVHLPCEVWLQVLAWIHRMELAERTSFACRSISKAAHIRLHEKFSEFPDNNTRRMCWLTIYCEKMENGELKYEPVMFREGRQGLYKIEWPETPLPRNIVGMGLIRIRYFDAKVFAFLARIKRLLFAGQLHLDFFDAAENFNTLVALERILPICIDANFSMLLSNAKQVGQINLMFPQLLAQCRPLRVGWVNSEDAEHLDAMVKWMAEPGPDRQPKSMFIVCVHSHELLLSKVKEQFRLSTTPSPFLLCVGFENSNEFCEQNARTGEQFKLTSKKYGTGWKYALITRCATRSAQQHNFVELEQRMRKHVEQKFKSVYDANDEQSPELFFDVDKIGNLDGICWHEGK